MSDTGFVYGATGQGYVALAAQSARSLRAVMPEAQIDLFCDAAPEGAEGLFDQVHLLGEETIRPKFDALLHSRFERTLYLDADLFVLQDLSDVFELLTRFDIAAAHDQGRNNPHCLETWRCEIPAAFPQLNGGVFGARRNSGTQALFDDLRTAFAAEGRSRDQPIIRELVWLSDLRLAVLPPEYNLMYYNALEVADQNQCAPRILHSSRLRRHIGKPVAPVKTLEEMIGPRLAAMSRRWRPAITPSAAAPPGG